MEFASDLTIDPDAESTTQACGTLSESRTTIANSFEVNENSDIYYLGSTYWNDLEVVQRRINERISGDPTREMARTPGPADRTDLQAGADPQLRERMGRA